MDTKDLDRHITGHWGEDSVPSQDDETKVAEIMIAARELLRQTKNFELTGKPYPGKARLLAQMVLSYFGESE